MKNSGTCHNPQITPTVSAAARQFHLQTGQVRLISKNLAGRPGNGPSDSPSITHGSDRVVFQSTATDLMPSDTNGQSEVFLWVGQADVIAGRLSFSLSGDQAGSSVPSVCAVAPYGDWVTFTSDSTSLVPGVTVGGTHLYLTSMNLQEGNNPYLPQR